MGQPDGSGGQGKGVGKTWVWLQGLMQWEESAGVFEVAVTAAAETMLEEVIKEDEMLCVA